jgi:hypothetical protein
MGTERTWTPEQFLVALAPTGYFLVSPILRERRWSGRLGALLGVPSPHVLCLRRVRPRG